MKCAKCGAEIRPGCVYCSNCGQEAQIVTEINILEDDLLRSMLEEEEKSGSQTETLVSIEKTAEKTDQKPHGTKTASDSSKKKKKRMLEKKRKKARKTLVILVVLLIAALAVAFGVMQYNHSNSVSYQLKKATEALDQKNYTSALQYAEYVLQLDSENEDALVLEGQIYVLMKQDAKAETVLLWVIDQNPSCKKAYEQLLSLYDSNNSYDQILALKSKVTDSKILSLFDQYLLAAPEIDKEGGNYNEFLEVTLSVDGKGIDIYYTLDGSVPTDADKKYEDPIQIEEQGKTTLTAIAMDKNGKYSEPVSAEYNIELDAPDMPSVYPDGGTYHEQKSVHVTVPSGTTVYYTWDGSTPTSNSSVYRDALDIPEGNNILSLVAIDDNGLLSEVLKCNYIYYPTSTTDSDTQDGASSDAE